MENRRNHVLAGRGVRVFAMLALPVLLSLAGMSGCSTPPPNPAPAPSGNLQVHQVTTGVPTWLEPWKYNYKIYLSVVFTQPVDVATLTMPGTVNLTFKRLSGPPKEVSNIPGVVYPSADKQTIVFVSDKTGSELGVSPGAGVQTVISITLKGTGAPGQVVKSQGGQTLDGDKNGQPGGDFSWKSKETIG